MDFRTMEITDRTKEDYFTFESPVWIILRTPNADKFFNQVFTDRASRKYAQRSFGYMMTGDTTAQVFFIWYGKGRNGKSVTANLMEAILSENFPHQCDKSIFIKNQKGNGASRYFSRPSWCELFLSLEKRLRRSPCSSVGPNSSQTDSPPCNTSRPCTCSWAAPFDSNLTHDQHARLMRKVTHRPLQCDCGDTLAGTLVCPDGRKWEVEWQRRPH
jgi:hypothetical protein